MADWKRLAKNLILADGAIGQRETEVVKTEFLADHLIDRSEAEFLLDLRRSASVAHADFHRFVLGVVKKLLLADGRLDAAEAVWLQRFVLSDGKVDPYETQLLRELKAGAKATSPEFDGLYKRLVQG
ncbi:MAG: TerB family tellurite resistance protein [Gemmataceae bacterium]